MNDHPTAREIRQERAALVLTLADCAVAGLLIGVALLTNSLSIFAEVVWAVFLVALQVYTAWVSLTANRGTLRAFEFGTSKIEQTVWAVLGVGLLVGGFWVTERIIGVVLGIDVAVRPAGFALAGFASAVALLAGFFTYSPAMHIMPPGQSSEFQSRVSVRKTTLHGTVVVQLSLTLAVLARDPEVAVAADALGAAFVTTLCLWRGVGALCLALPDLIDAPAPVHAGRKIRAAVETVLPPGEFVGLRTRRCGRAIEAEISVAGNSCHSTADLARLQREIARHEAVRDARMNVVLVLAAAGSIDTVSSAAMEMRTASHNRDLEDKA